MASAYRRIFYVHVSTNAAGNTERRFVARAEGARLRDAGERVEEIEGDRWYVKYRDAGGGWRNERTTARTKAEAQRLALDLERKAERQRHGLEPLPGDMSMSLADLCDWWLREKCPPASVAKERSRLRLHVMDRPLGKLPLARVSSAKVEERLRDMERAGLGPSSTNHLRRILLGIFRRAARAGLWLGPNPIEAVETRREVERAYATLRAHEVPVFLENTPEHWRDLFATALLLGLRKGELFALKKSDIDLVTRTATIHRSHERSTTKGGHVDKLPIAPQLVPFLEHALASSGSEYLFPGPDGGMRSKENDMARLTQVICKHAGLVEGYEHVCRRCKHAGKEHVWRHADDRQRKCPTCRMRLWVKSIPRPMRFHDTRHTYGTLLAQAGFDGVRLQRAMRHRDFKMTARYVHTNVEDLRAMAACLPAVTEAPAKPGPPAAKATGAGRRGSGAKAVRLGAGLVQVGGAREKEGPGSRKNSKETRPL